MSDPNSNISPTRQSGQNHRDYYTALYQAALEFSSSLDLHEVLSSIVKSITEAMQVKGCGIRLLDTRSGRLQIVATYGLSRDYIAKGPVELASSPIDSEAMCGTPVIIEDIENDSRFQYKEAAKREGIVSVLCVPLEVRGEAIGVLRVYTSERHIFHEDDIQFLSVLASLAALAISNANLYESLKYAYDGVMDVLWGSSVEIA
ncbi:MAG TPA: GAF domain-containing protein [Ktedonobacteraceae bacterium]|nr:GAF domain-containing protein [Ktedonobacteraceae bacterium]